MDPERAILIGQSGSGRVLLVVFIEQSEDTIRDHQREMQYGSGKETL